MEFQSIEQVRQMLGISLEDPEEIKREVRRKLLEVHPDALAGAGLPEDKAKSEETLLLTAALNFLNRPEHSTDIIARERETELVTIARDLAEMNQARERQNEQQELARREGEAAQTLARQSNSRVQQVRSAGRLRIFGLGTVTLILSGLWLAPQAIVNQPYLGEYPFYTYATSATTGDRVEVATTFFTSIWVCSLLITAVAWLLVSWRNEQEGLFQRGLNLERTQNLLFDSFRKKANSAGATYFQKSEFVTYVEDESVELRYEILRDGITPLQRVFVWPLLWTSKKPIDAELAENVADLVLTRGEAAGVIEKADSLSLDERYILKSLDNTESWPSRRTKKGP